MADNNTFVLFEEIKNKLETIYREVKELKEKGRSSISLTTPSTPVQQAGDNLQGSKGTERKGKKFYFSHYSIYTSTK